MDTQLMDLGLTKREGRIVVSSRDIAHHFEKEHKIVMRDIRAIIAQEPNWGDGFNYVPISEADSYGREQPAYLMTRDGFTLLVMGYTGKNAMTFKKSYIAAFNEMESSFVPRNYKEALRALADKEEEREALEAQNEVLKLTEAKYEGQTDTTGLYRTGEIAKELGVSAIRLNNFLRLQGIQYKPNGSPTWQLYTDYADEHLAVTKLVRLDHGYDIPMLLWTPKGRDFIFDLCEKEMLEWYA